MLARGADERDMAGVERAHGGDEADGLRGGAEGAHAGAEFVDGAEDFH